MFVPLTKAIKHAGVNSRMISFGQYSTPTNDLSCLPLTGFVWHTDKCLWQQTQDLHMRFICSSLKLATSIPCNVILWDHIIINSSESDAILSSIGQDGNFPVIKFPLY